MAIDEWFAAAGWPNALFPDPLQNLLCWNANNPGKGKIPWISKL